MPSLTDTALTDGVPTIKARAGTLKIEMEAGTGLDFTITEFFEVDKTVTPNVRTPLNITGYTWEVEVYRERCAEEIIESSTPTVSVATTNQVQTIQTRADVAGDLGATFFDLTAFATDYRVWFDVDAGSTAPAAGGRTLVEVDIATGATADAVASALQLVIDALGDLTATVSTDTVTVTHDVGGFATAAVDGSAATGFTFAVTTVGDQDLTVSFSEANITAINGDAFWKLFGTPASGSRERWADGPIEWIE